MRFEDQGLILNNKNYGESSKILSIYCKGHGIVKGFIRPTKKTINQLQLGNVASLLWTARLETQLGRFQIESATPLWVKYQQDSLKLALFQSACELCDKTLAERQIYPNHYDELLELLLNISLEKYIKFEVSLLSHIGFGLSLDHCVVTESDQDLMYVSPRSGAAVCKDAARGYEDKLFPLPSFLTQSPNPDLVEEDFEKGLALCGYFFKKSGFFEQGFPPTRQHVLWLMDKKKAHNT